MEDFTRRRRIQEDDDDEEMGSKRIRGPDGADIGKKLINMISRVDENVKGTLENTLEQLSITLEENLEPYEGQIISILSECAMYLPEKLTMFTTLIGLLNSKNSEFGANMVSKLVSQLNDSFVKEDYDIALRLCTFVSDLGNASVIDTQSIMNFLSSFVNLIGEENAQSNFFAYLVLHALPWIGPELQESKPAELGNMLNLLENYLRKRNKLYAKMLQVWSSNQPHSQDDYLDCLWTQIQKLKKDKWLEHHIVRIYASFKDTFGSEAIVRHKIPTLGAIQSFKNFPLPKIVFRLFDYTDIPDNIDQALPPDTSIERFLVEEDLNWIIDNNYLEWHLCAKVLLNYHRREAVPLNYVIIEVIFGQLFRLPRAPHLELFYGALLIELCRTKPESMPQVLAQAAELLYQRADFMQQICLDRFVDWFSYHLSNFQYRWSWSDWADCLELDSLHPRRIFVREVIEKCLRLSYHKKVVEFLPNVFQDIIPPEPSIIYVLDDEKHELKEHAQDFYALMTEKRPAEEIIKLLENNSCEDEDMEENETSYDPNSVAVFCAVLFKLASRTFSHSFAALTKYHKIFRTVVENSKEMQSVILRTLYDCWNRHKQMLTVLVDKLLKMQIIDPAVVQAWVFCDDMKREFKRSWVWDVLNTAITRLECHHLKLSDAQKELKVKIEELKCESAQTEDELINNSTDEKGIQRPKITAPDVDPKKEMDVDSIVPDADITEFKGKGNSSLQALEKKLADSTVSLEEVEENLRTIILNICHKFTLILAEHLLNCENDESEIETDFYNYVLGRFRHIFLAHSDSMLMYLEDLDRELFNTPTIEKRIREIFLEFQALKC